MTFESQRRLSLPAVALLLAGAATASAQSIRVQCPAPSEEHPNVVCDHLAAGDGFVTMADGRQLYMFGFARLPLGLTDPSEIMEAGMLAATFPAPPIVVDEGDELYLTLTNVGMAMRPDLFDSHTIHWHGFPEAGAIFDGVPDSSISINMSASLT